MKHGIYILAILMVLLGLPESGYASIPFFAVANDTIRRVMIYFDANVIKVIIRQLQLWILCFPGIWVRNM